MAKFHHRAGVPPTNKTHGLSHSPEWHVWKSMRRRCHNPKDNNYRHYGARGIFVCERWQTSFLNFIEDIGRRPSPDHQLERIDNNDGYHPKNCRWATRREQANNTRKNIHYFFNGEKLTLSEAARRLNVDKWHIDKMLIRIDHGIPMPKKHPGAPIYPFGRMKIGESFIFPKSTQFPAETARSYSHRNPRKQFSVRKTSEGYRCWRIA